MTTRPDAEDNAPLDEALQAQDPPLLARYNVKIVREWWPRIQRWFLEFVLGDELYELLA